MTPHEKGISWLLPIYCLAALALSLWLLQFNYFIGDDGVYYARVGRNIFQGMGIAANPGEPYLIHPPFYPFLVGLLNVFIRNLEFSGHLVSILAFSLTLVPLFLFTRDVYGENSAHWASLLYLTHGYLLIHSNLVMTECLFTLLIMIQLYGTNRIIQGGTENAGVGILVGIFSGLAFLTRPEGFLFFLACSLAIFLLSEKSLASKFKLILISGVVFLLFFLPQVYFVYQKSHKLQLSQGVTEIFIKRQMDLAEGGTRQEARKIYEGLTSDQTHFKMEELVHEFHLIPNLVKDHFAFVWSALASLIWRLTSLNEYLYAGLGFFLIGAGWLSIPWDSRRRKSEFLILLFLSTFLCKLFSQFLPQYYFHYFPIFLIWIGNGVEVLRNWAGMTFRLKRSRVIALAFCALLALPSAGYLRRILTQFPAAFEYQELGLWMRKNIPQIENETIASRQPAVSFYSGGRILKLPYVHEIENLMTFMKFRGAKYFVVSDNPDLPYPSAYDLLLDETRLPPPGLSREYVLHGRHKLILYKLV